MTLLLLLVPVVGVMLRFETLSSPKVPQAPGFSIELVGWPALTLLLLGITSWGMQTVANLQPKTLKVMAMALVALTAIYLGVFGLSVVIKQGIRQEMLLAGLTTVYTGLGLLGFSLFTPNRPLKHRHIGVYVRILLILGLGTWFIVLSFL